MQKAANAFVLIKKIPRRLKDCFFQIARRDLAFGKRNAIVPEHHRRAKEHNFIDKVFMEKSSVHF